MKPTVRVLRCQVLLCLLVLSLVWTNIGAAQQPEPSAAPGSPAADTQPSVTLQEGIDYKAYPLDQPLPSPAAPASAAGSDAKAASAAPASAAPSAAPQLLGAAPNAVAQPNIQGVVTLDVSTPDTIRAGDAIDYTYSYVNQTGTTVTDVEIQAVWVNFRPWPDGGVWQWCEPGMTGCGFLPDSVQGPEVTPLGTPDTVNGMRFKVAALAPGARGQFTLRLRTNPGIFPRTNAPIVRPAGSAKLFTAAPGGAGSNAPTSDDTANTMVIGPVFVLNKTALNTEPVYPGETAEFKILVGNATGPGDTVNGQQVRADATDATNVVITDAIPWGSEFVTANPTPSKVEQGKVSWNLGALAVGSTEEVRVTFRKADVDAGCDAVDNNNYSVTSAEMPLDNGAQMVVRGNSASVRVTRPMIIESVISTPWDRVYGDTSDITIKVQNFWNQPVVGAQLHYDIQTNAYYVPGTTTQPTATVVPDSQQAGGRITWTFNMEAGSKTAPKEKTFTLRIRGGYTSAAEKGIAQLVLPNSVPSKCTYPVGGRLRLTPRLVVTKQAELDPSKTVGSAYRVKRGDRVWYTVEVQNVGVADATGVQVRDLLPQNEDANFSYVPGSATLDGAAREPNIVTNGRGGTLVWTGITIPVRTKKVFRYQMVVNGRDYYDYCNTVRVSVSESAEEIAYSRDGVCVKINPDIDTEKTVDHKEVQPNGTVKFTLTLTNNETTPYNVGLYDRMGAFTFVEQIEGYNQPERLPNNDLRWPLKNVAPGETISVTFTARVPNVCRNEVYRNQVLFYNTTNIITEVPEEYVDVKVVCNELHYETWVESSPVSLQDRVLYNVVVRNVNASTAIQNVSVDMLLPEGFRWDGIAGDTGVVEPPAQSTRNGRTVLTWDGLKLEPSSEKRIRFFARSGNIVGLHEARAAVRASNAVLSCRRDCKTYTDNGVAREFSTTVVQVEPLITLASEIDPNVCTTPGASLTYRVQLVNTNSHAYNNTTVRTSLPLGLAYVKSRPGTPAPIATTNADGVTQLAWLGTVVPAKSRDAAAGQVTFEVEVKVGQVWGKLTTLEQATSSDGSIPRKDDTKKAEVQVCPSTPAIAKIASQTYVRYGNTVLYQISLANPTNGDNQVTVEDTLPQGLAYVEMASGPEPRVSPQKNTLQWQVTVPAGTPTAPGTVSLQVRVRVLPTAPPTALRNVATVPTDPSFDARYNGANIVPFGNIYVPWARR